MSTDDLRVGRRSRFAASVADSSAAEVIAIVVASGLLIGLVAFAAATIGTAIYPEVTDARADWLSVTAANSGIDPWADLRDLASRFGVEYRPMGVVELGAFQRAHPRTPAALLLLWPLTLVSAEGAYVGMIALASISFLAVPLVVLPTQMKSSIRFTAIGGTLLVASAAYLATLKFGSQSAFLLFLVSLSWVLTRKRDSPLGGLFLGVVIALRLFPALLLIPLWRHGRRQAVYVAVLTFGLLNVAGLWFYDLNVLDAIEGLRTAAEGWVPFSGNGSILMPLTKLGLNVQSASIVVGAIAITLAMVIPIKGRSLDLSLSLTLMIALISSPISWEHYDVMAFLVVAYLAAVISRNSRASTPLKFALGLWLTIQLVSPRIAGFTLGERAFTLSGPMALAGRIVLFAALVYLVLKRRPTSTNLEPSQPDRSNEELAPLERQGV